MSNQRTNNQPSLRDFITKRARKPTLHEWKQASFFEEYAMFYHRADDSLEKYITLLIIRDDQLRSIDSGDTTLCAIGSITDMIGGRNDTASFVHWYDDIEQLLFMLPFDMRQFLVIKVGDYHAAMKEYEAAYDTYAAAYQKEVNQWIEAMGGRYMGDLVDGPMHSVMHNAGTPIFIIRRGKNNERKTDD